MKIKFKQTDIFQENAQLIVFVGRKSSMASIDINRHNYHWDDWVNLNQTAVGNLILLDLEMANDEQNKEIIHRILDLAIDSSVTSLSFTGIRDTEQQYSTRDERIANQNRRCIQSVYEVLTYLNGKIHSIESFSFCSFTADYFLRVFQEEIEV